MDLSTVHQGVHKHRRKKRVGRGIGSGHGKTATRGSKGQYASAGAEMFKALFEGGQTPLYRRSTKRGFSHRSWDKDAHVINVGALDAAHASGAEIKLETLQADGVLKGTAKLLRVLGDGEVGKKLTVHAHHFSASAKDKIEKAGGQAVLIPAPKKPVRNKMRPRPAKAV
jgi:large subunit ribosomal protein L15